LDLWLDWKVHSFDLEDLLFERKVQRVEGLAQSEEQKVHSVFLQDLSVFLQDLWVFLQGLLVFLQVQRLERTGLLVCRPVHSYASSSHSVVRK